MIEALRRYARWLHLDWPAGKVEPLPEIRQDGSTRVPGVYVSGDLTGIPLLKFALHSGASIAARIARDPALRKAPAPAGTLDLVIVGAGVSGMAAAVEALRLGLSFEILEASEPLSTLINFPRRKPIFTYPRDMVPAGVLQVRADVKEELVAELSTQVEEQGIRPTPGRAERIERAGGLLVVHVAGAPSRRARRVLVAVGRTGDFRRLNVPGESRDVVTNRLHDPADFAGKRTLVVGGGDTAVETAMALAGAAAWVTLVHRGGELTRPKPENLERLELMRRAPETSATITNPRVPEPGSVDVRLGTRVVEIRDEETVVAASDGTLRSIPTDAVFVMIGREPPHAFLRASGISILGDWSAARAAGLAAFLLFAAFLYDWKSGGFFDRWFQARQWFPYNVQELVTALGSGAAELTRDPRTLLGTLTISAASPSFWYTVAYSALIVVFGIRRIRRRRTPYVTAQTLVLMAVQVVPLFVLPEVVLPLLDRHGLLPAPLADALFPRVDYGHGREFWRAYGLILAWPLNVYNVFTPEPLPAWLAISVVQTAVLIPLAIYFFGKGAYCGWICSCGALAETLGDTHRHKMPHGPGWNRLNLAGQGILAVAVILLVVRIAGWMLPSGHPVDRVFDPLLKTPYKWGVDVFLAGVLGYGLYFWFSGRVWCRFFCPLAALMHVYARFTSFRILADKKKCISCGLCTSACHQGIDVMGFANKGAPMADPQCVRCSACVQVCPTGVLSFGRVGRDGELIALDTLAASPVRSREGD